MRIPGSAVRARVLAAGFCAAAAALALADAGRSVALAQGTPAQGSPAQDTPAQGTLAQNSNAKTGPSAEVQPATLLADRILLQGTNTLIAEGNVEIYWRDHRLSARSIRYDDSTGQLSIEGPIRLVEPGAGGTVILADSAEMRRDLQQGVLIGARMVLARELQLAANRIERQGEGRTVLHEVVASSCRICATEPTPLWEIRARTITHDATRQQLHFDGAQFRAMGVPLLYLPRLRMPDPGVTRMSGFLRPGFRTTSSLGPGLKMPYFLTLGPTADLTFTPYLATAHTATLGLRYRQALSFGAFELEGALSRDSIRPGETRGYLFGSGSADLPRGFRLAAQLRTTSDPSYLLNYGLSDEDRLWSGVTLERVRKDEMIWAKIGNTHSMREGESNSTEPMFSGDASWTRVFRPATIGGELTLEGSLHAHRRAATLAVDGLADADTEADGRDMLRAAMLADWRRNWLLPGGVLAAAQAELAFDASLVRQDAVFAGNSLRALPSLGVELRWPWVATSGRAAQVIEPVVQLIWSRDDLETLPNEDSRLLEFDEGNLFAFSRFPGGDAREAGARANLGLSWTRHDASGWSLGVTAGRVLRLDDLGQFSPGTGLSGRRSDWLVAAHLRNSAGLTLSNRALFDDDFGFSRDELRLAYLGRETQIAAGYLWMQADAAEGRPLDTSELLFESGWQWAEGWRSTFDTRYDFTADRAARAAFGLQYTNECLSVDLSLSRRFTSSTSVEPETDFGLSVELVGFGAGAAGGRADRVCRR